MMNMFQLQERIKDFSKDQLIREMQQPSGAVPPFLLLSELQRRTRMEKAFQADQAQGQQSTVAQDAVAAAGVPQGGIADMARAMAPQTDMTQNTGTPVQAMAEGGEVRGMQQGGALSRPSLVVRNGIQYAQMADGSLIPLGQLGFSPEELAGAGTADLVAPQPTPSPATGPLPTQADLDQRFLERELGITGVSRSLEAPELSITDGAVRPDADTPVGGSRVPPALPALARERTSPRADILRPPSVSYLQMMGALDETDREPRAPFFGSIDDVVGVGDLELGGLPLTMTDPTAEREGAYDRVADLVGLSPAIDAIPRSPETMPMDTGTPLTVPEEADGGIEALLPPRPAAASAGGAGGAGGTGGGAGGAGARATGAADADKWLALAQFGLGLMASQQPTFGGAIGEAGLAALGQLREARKEAYERDLAERTLAARSAGSGRDRGALTANQALDAINDRIDATNLALTMATTPEERMRLSDQLALLESQAARILSASGFGPATAAALEAGVDLDLAG